MKVAIDTNVVVGLLDERDVWHAGSVSLLEAVETAGLETVYFDCVMTEAVSTVGRRLHEKRRSADLSALLDNLLARFPTDDLFWILPDVPQVYPAALELIRSTEGELNFNDALIAIACRDYEIPLLVSFDPDFDQISWLRRLSLPEHVK
ncbi:MAG: type II toxin-antitoxin system VapC family toxin [Chloroflexi bacterium]|nr:type II toxin-antitoxin system VapC family toxin [Chloroflexota bacterium]